MRFALISDIHSNLESLTGVFTHIAAEDAVYCLGDIVGYGPDPNACVALVRARAAQVVLGNHDVAAVDGYGLDYFNDDAREALEWTQAVLERDHVTWLDGLAYEFRRGDYLLVHGAPVEYFRYILDFDTARLAFAATDATLVFVGHTHVPGFYVLEPDGSIAHEFRRNGGRLDLRAGRRYIVNPGSVGQPRDRNPEASFAFYDPAARTIEWRRVPYEVAVTQRKIGEARLPGTLAWRLAAGR